MTKDLTALRTQGWGKLRDGKIHLRCPKCGMKRSNNDRQPHDPPAAFLAELQCPECVGGDFGGSETYFDASGHELPDEEKPR